VYALGFVSIPPTVAAQATRPRTVTVPEGFIVEAERAAAERDALKRILTIKDEQIGAQKDQIAALNGLLGIERSRGDNWMKAALERKDAIVFDDAAFKIQGQDLLRVRAERDKARSGQKVWGAVGLVLGIALGVYSQKGN
jgi:hypothetical protein